MTTTEDEKYDGYIWLWYSTLCLVSVVNIGVYMSIICDNKQVKGAKDINRYMWWMQFLAGPYVFQCAWRSFWPEIYNERIAFWDTPLNSIFLGRGLATIGEVTWIMQVALGLMWCNKEISVYDGDNGGSLNFWSKMAVFLCFTAEFFCNHATITLCYFWNVIETSLWTVALGALIPGVLRLNRRAKQIHGARASRQKQEEIDATSVIFFTYMVLLVCILFVVQLCVDHIPL